MYKFLTVLVFLASVNASAKYCNPEVSRPCGKACISKELACHKNWTTNDVGVAPSKQGKEYSTDEVKRVDMAPTSKK